MPTLEGEFDRKRRMMRGLWDIVVRDGMVSPRGYPALYGFEIASHRLLRYASPVLHVAAFAANLVLLGRGRIYRLALAAQLALLVAARVGQPTPRRALAAALPLLRLRHRLDRAGLWDRCAPGPARRVGEIGGDAMSRRLRRRRLGRARARRLGSRRFCSLIAIAIRLDSRGPVDLPPAPGRPRRRGVRAPQVPHDAPGLRPGRDRHGGGDGRPARHPGRRAPAPATSLDELPNLVNVLRGEMAIVGPRPTIPAQVELYSERQRRRLEVKPGLTGWAQVSGHVGIPWDERIELDIWYVEHRSARARPADPRPHGEAGRARPRPRRRGVI